jgi:hypothetical protein
MGETDRQALKGNRLIPMGDSLSAIRGEAFNMQCIKGLINKGLAVNESGSTER